MEEMDNSNFNDFNRGGKDELIDPDVQSAVDLAVSICHTIPFRNKQNKSANTDMYKVLTSDEIVQYVVDFVQDVNGIIQLKSTVTRMLLSYCKWDKILLTEKFYADPEKLFKEARVLNPFTVLISADSPTNECEICCDDLTTSATATIACGHRFCASCWSEYLKVKIMDEGVSNSILCAANDCDVIIDDETVTELVGDLEAKRRYQRLIINSFVHQNQLLRWCPAPGCSYAIKVGYSPLKPIYCNCICGHEFCFDCSEEWHFPAPCELLRRFKGHLADGLFHIRWGHISCDGRDDRIKNCPNPNCSVSIQKVSGCNVMQCKNCDTIFCWECLNRFKTKYAVYQHYCNDDSKAEDVTEPKKTEKSDDIELAPPKTFSRLTTDSTTTTRKNTADLCTNRRHAAVSNGGPLERAPVDRIDIGEELGAVNVVDETTLNYLPFSQPRLFENLIAQRRQRVMKALELEPRRLESEPRRLELEPRRLELEPRRLRRFNVGNRGNNKYYQKYTAEDAHFRIELAHSANIKQSLQYCKEKLASFVQFEKASIYLAQSRQTLKYTAIFAMYLNNVSKSMLFKNLYLDFEVAVNALSNGIMSLSLHDTNSASRIAETVLPSFRNCQLRRRALLNYIDEGYDNEWWFFEDQPRHEYYLYQHPDKFIVD